MMTTRDVERIRFVTRHFHDLQGLRYWVPLGMITLSVGGTTYFAKWSFVFLRAALFLGGLLLMWRSRRYYPVTFGKVEHKPAPLPAAEWPSIYSPAGVPQRLAFQPLVHPAAWRWLLTLGFSLALFLTLSKISPFVGLDTDESLVQTPWQTLHSGISVFIMKGIPFPEEWWHTVRIQLLYVLYGSFFLGLWLWRGCRLSQLHNLLFGALLVGLAAFGASLGLLWAIPWDQGILNFLLPAVAHLWVALLLCGSLLILAGLRDHWQLARVLKPVAEAQS